jgi:predicted  nucleic acid-binding Zn-ribbon protein
MGLQITKPKNDPNAQSDLMINQISELNRRMRLIEEQISGIREHTSLIESNITQRDKKTTEELNNFSEEMHDFHNQIREIKDAIDQIASKFDQFANKEQVKVLERYINIWNPMNFLTKDEVESFIDKKLAKLKNV